MDLQLTGKRALITGSTAGIGQAIARELAAEGAHVLVNGRDETEVDRVVAELRDLPGSGGATGVPGDLATSDGTDEVATRAQADGPVDILINNVSRFGPKGFFEIPDEEWLAFFQTNVMSGVRLSRALIPGMRERDWGRVLFISSESALNVDHDMLHYSMTKTAQLTLARGLAQITRGSNVTVNSVLPGPTWTEGVEAMMKSMAEESGEDLDALRKRFVPDYRGTSCIQRFATPEEVAGIVAFLCSPRASAISGTAHRVDGGVVAVPF